MKIINVTFICMINVKFSNNDDMLLIIYSMQKV